MTGQETKETKGTGAIAAGELETWTERLRSARRNHGASQAMQECFSPLLDGWLACLESEDKRLDKQEQCTLAVGLHESLALRDALIISVIIDGEQWDKELLMRFAAHPHTSYVAERMSAMLSGSFEDPQAAPDPRRCMLASRQLRDVACLVPPGAYTVQPNATIGYLAWWQGQVQQAREYATQALQVDGDCTLAAIVMAAIDRHIMPAWVTAD